MKFFLIYCVLMTGYDEPILHSKHSNHISISPSKNTSHCKDAIEGVISSSCTFSKKSCQLAMSCHTQGAGEENVPWTQLLHEISEPLSFKTAWKPACICHPFMLAELRLYCIMLSGCMI